MFLVALISTISFFPRRKDDVKTHFIVSVANRSGRRDGHDANSNNLEMTFADWRTEDTKGQPTRHNAFEQKKPQTIGQFSKHEWKGHAYSEDGGTVAFGEFDHDIFSVSNHPVRLLFPRPKIRDIIF
ncbi:hypothetical protein L596_024687 [Steinernema carpocapsae]|uniref:Uncharacterized protein n=1 Tax=Steinernema carpocapsae TaxID=34508 RepID=A0A4U5M5H0_STECR|nr:hypothetical protein L596_024687 [Steinernema carpocapsae]